MQVRYRKGDTDVQNHVILISMQCIQWCDDHARSVNVMMQEPSRYCSGARIAKLFLTMCVCVCVFVCVCSDKAWTCLAVTRPCRYLVVLSVTVACFSDSSTHLLWRTSTLGCWTGCLPTAVITAWCTTRGSCFYQGHERHELQVSK